MLRGTGGGPHTTPNPKKSAQQVSGGMDAAAEDTRKAPVKGLRGFLRSRARDIAVAALLTLACGWLAQRVAPPEGSPLSRAAAPYSSRPAASRRVASRVPVLAPPADEQPALGGARNRSRLPDVADRRAGAVLGSFTADAAAMGLHWIYDTTRLAKMVDGRPPEFHKPPACPFYKYESGEQSPYGDEELLLLQAVVEGKGVDGAAIQQALYRGFKAYGGRLNSASTKLVQAVDRGCAYPDCAPQDDQAHGLVKVAVVAARYAGSPLLVAKMEEAVRAHQSHPLSISTAVDAAKLLEHVILHGSVSGAIEWGLQAGHLSDSGRRFLSNAHRSRHSQHTAAVRKFGQTCHLPGSFESMLHGALSSTSYEEAVRRTILAGGDNCSRATLLGALFGAEGGAAAIPESWRSQVRRYTQLSGLVQQLVVDAASS
mmetsp:Transcript_46777/g.119337  ORF Transcript_46777/g.119337 Transcript_46777/m.119337 type:complete len:428 (-) Transcript_46777:73-1356(-)|eukprot:jgi/Tetstr1/461830/TSEL_006909.t1